MNLRLIIISSVCAMLGFSCGSEPKNYQNITRPVRVVKVETLGFMHKMYTGVVGAEEYSKLAFEVSGPLIQMNVDAGQKVKKGDVIAIVDPLDYNLQNEANRAAYITAKSQLERNRKLLEKQAVSRQEYEIAEANYVKTKSAYETSENTLSDTKLKAPFDGFIEQKYVENYQKVQVGESIVKLVNPNKLEISFILPETDVRLTREKMEVSVEFDTYKGQWFKARVKEFIDASPDGSGIPVRLAIVDTAFINGYYNVYPGFSCKIKLSIAANTGGYSVPLSAIFTDMKTSETSVWLYNSTEKAVERQKVTTSQLFGDDKVEVVSGLNTEDIIIVAGVNYITEGQKVSVVNN